LQNGGNSLKGFVDINDIAAASSGRKARRVCRTLMTPKGHTDTHNSMVVVARRARQVR
jgi:hypothetical protein